MYTAALVWFTPLPRAVGNKRSTSTAITRPAAAGTSTVRHGAVVRPDPSSSQRIHSMAMRKHTTAIPENTPMKMASSRKNCSWRSAAVMRRCASISREKLPTAVAR
jgi:hypothetical protein